jgi:hypothetical protein
MSEESETTATPKPAQRVSSYFFLTVFIVLIISFAALALAVTNFHGSGLQNNFLPIVFLVIGFVGVSFSTYVLFQTRKRVQQVSLELPPVMTTITCQKCGFKNQRVFERGDYVFKDAGPCPKCNNNLLVSAIYREVKEKPKKEMF